MSDSRLRRLERLVALNPRDALALSELDAERRRVGDGPWLPAKRVAPVRPWAGLLGLMWGEGIGVTARVERVTLAPWGRRVVEFHETWQRMGFTVSDSLPPGVLALAIPERGAVVVLRGPNPGNT